VFALLELPDLGQALGGVVGGIAPLFAGLFLLVAGIFGSKEKAVGALPMFFLAALCCLVAFLFAPDTGVWTGVERVAWWVGGFTGGLGALVAFQQRGGAMRGLACTLCLAGFAGVALHSPATTEVRLDRVGSQRVQLETQLGDTVPKLLDQQQDAFEAVQAELGQEGLSIARQSELESEGREIVRFVMALERHRERGQETLSRLRSLERTLERQSSAEELLGGEEQLVEEYELVSREAGARLAVVLDTSIGMGVIADAEVEARYRELLGH